jgi:hypothetical protein
MVGVPRIISGLYLLSIPFDVPFTEATVPTGIKIGVSITP